MTYPEELRALVEHIDPLHYDKICDWRSEEWLCFPDKNGHNVYGRMGCKRSDSPRCAEALRQDMVAGAMEVDSAIHHALGVEPKYLMFVTTLHPKVQERFSKDDVPWLRRESENVFREYYLRLFPELKGTKFRFGIRKAVQYWHSENPFRGQFYHLQAIFYNFIWLPLEQRRQWIPVYLACDNCRRMGVKKCPHEVAWLRERWKLKQEEKFHVDIGDESNLHIQYGRGEFRLENRGLYDWRLPIKDLADYYLKGNHTPKDVDWDWMRHLLLTRGDGIRTVTQGGWLQNRNLNPDSPFMKRVGLKLQLPEVRCRERRKKVCEICGGVHQLDMSRGSLTRDQLGAGAKIWTWAKLHDPVYRPEFKKWWAD